MSEEIIDLPVKKDSETPEFDNTGAPEVGETSFSGSVTVIE